MKKYVFVITDRNRSSLHVGLSTDLIQTVQFYRSMPSLFFDTGLQPGRLVYFEEYHSENAASRRFELISRFTRLQKERLVRAVNADWIDLAAGLLYEQAVYTGSPHTPKAIPVSKKGFHSKRQAA